MQTVLEQGSIDKPLTFDVGLNSVSYQSVYLIHATFQSNCVEGLHFSAFHFHRSNMRKIYLHVPCFKKMFNEIKSNTFLLTCASMGLGSSSTRLCFGVVGVSMRGVTVFRGTEKSIFNLLSSVIDSRVNSEGERW